MTLNNKLVTWILAIAMVMGTAVSTEAAPSRRGKKTDTSDAGAIIFRIENIEPMRNKDGLIDKCSFMLTAFNRMDRPVREAEIQLNWADKISNRYDIKNDQVIALEDAEVGDVVASKIMTLSSLQPHRQKSFSAEVNTDKCFLLLDNLEYHVNFCFLEDEKMEMKDSKLIGNGSCTGNFNYISSKNSEYYSEFKDVPESVLEKQAEEEKKNEIAKVTEKYNSTISELKAISETLDRIK